MRHIVGPAIASAHYWNLQRGIEVGLSSVQVSQFLVRQSPRRECAHENWIEFYGLAEFRDCLIRMILQKLGKATRVMGQWVFVVDLNRQIEIGECLFKRPLSRLRGATHRQGKRMLGIYLNGLAVVGNRPIQLVLFRVETPEINVRRRQLGS